jgi:hypothetical protein
MESVRHHSRMCSSATSFTQFFYACVPCYEFRTNFDPHPDRGKREYGALLPAEEPTVPEVQPPALCSDFVTRQAKKFKFLHGAHQTSVKSSWDPTKRHSDRPVPCRQMEGCQKAIVRDIRVVISCGPHLGSETLKLRVATRGRQSAEVDNCVSQSYSL